jgi:hypothetical protein
MKKIFLAVIATVVTFAGFSNSAFATGVWDDNVTLLGVSPNGDYAAGDDVRVKKAAGNSGCTVVKFRPGSGNIPATSVGIDARNRIYATALAAYLVDKPVSIWVYDTVNCYGVALIFTDSSGF